MRILVIANDFPSPQQPEGGIFVLRQLRALAKLGYESLVVRMAANAPPLGSRWNVERSMPERDVIEGIPVRTLRAFFAPRMIGLEYLHLQVDRRIRRIIAEFKPTLVHAHFLLTSGHVAVHQRLPCVVTAHGADAYDWAWRRPGLRRAAENTVRKAGCVTAVSSFIRQKVQELAPRDVEVIYNGADEEVFAPRDRAQARRDLEIEQNSFVVAFAGELSAAKGVFDLIHAMEQLRGISALLLLAGRGSSWVTRSVLGRRLPVRVLGMLSHEKLAEVFAAADVVALPSYNEGLPVVLCEAMLAGRAVVATAVGGIPEIVADGERGYLIVPADTAALKERLERLARDRELAARMGSAGHGFAKRQLTWSINAQRYADIYQQVVAESYGTVLAAGRSRIQSAAR